MLQIMHDLAPGAELGFATAFISAALVRRQHPQAALRRRLRRDRRRHPLLQRGGLPGRPDRPGGQRRHRRRRAVLQLRRQRGQHARRHLRPLRGRVRRLRAARRQDLRRGARLGPRPRRAGLQPAERRQHRLGGDDVLGRAARPGDVGLRLLRLRQRRQPPELRPERAGRQRRRLRALRHGHGSAAATGSRSSATPASRATSRSRPSAGASRPPPTACRPGPRRASAAATRPPRTPSASPPRPPNLPYGSLLEPGDPPNPRGPFPEVFTVSQLPERFTSDGPRRIFFAADGTPAPQVRQKPEITAADGVVTTVPGFARFFGTSAAAPHAAAIAGLVLSGNPTATETDLRAGLRGDRARPRPRGRRQPHRPRHHPRRPRARVHGRHAAAARPRPAAAAGRDHRRRRRLPGAGGDRRRSRSRSTNVGDGTATGISVTATSDDPLAVLTPRNRNYGDLPAGASTVARLHARARRRLPARQARPDHRPRDLRRRALADHRDVHASPPGSRRRPRSASPTPARRSRSRTTAPSARR